MSESEKEREKRNLTYKLESGRKGKQGPVLFGRRSENRLSATQFLLCRISLGYLQATGIADHLLASLDISFCAGEKGRDVPAFISRLLSVSSLAETRIEKQLCSTVLRTEKERERERELEFHSPRSSELGDNNTHISYRA